MTAAADRIARLREQIGAYHADIPLYADVLALSDDYETLAARCTLTDEETEAVREWLHPSTPQVSEEHIDAVFAVLRRLLGDTP